MSSPEIDSNGIKWLFAHGTQTAITQSRNDPGDHRWSHDTPGAGKGYEVTWITSPTGVVPGEGSSSGHSALKFGGPNHSGDCGSESTHYKEGGECCCWYDLGIRATGKLQFQIERPHPDNSDFDANPLFENIGHEMEDHDSGMKIIAYPHINGGTAENGGIHIKYYVNSNALTNGVPNNNWRLAADILDNGQILGDGYEWPDYQELEVRNSDTDESNFYEDSVFFRFLTDADLQALRSGDPGGGGTNPNPPPGTGGTIITVGAVTNTTHPFPESGEWNGLDGQDVIVDTLNRQMLPVNNVDFLNTIYVVIGPPGKILRSTTPSTGGGGTGNQPGTRDVNVSVTVDFIDGMGGTTAREQFQVAASEEIIEVQTDPWVFARNEPAWEGPSLGEDPTRQIGDTPCDYAPGTEGNQKYPDGLQVEAYWSNEHEDCIIPDLTVGGTGENEDNLTYKGGPVMKNPKLWLIFWGTDWNNRTATPNRTQLTGDIRDKLLGTSSIFFSALPQYSGCGVPVWGGAVTVTNVPYPSGDFDDYIWDAGNVIWPVIDSAIENGQIPLSEIDFENTQFIVIPEATRAPEDYPYGGYHTDIIVSITFPETDPGTGSPEPTFAELAAGRGIFKPTIIIPGTAGTGIGGGTLPPDTTIPPPGASVIKPVVSYGLVSTIDASTSLITALLPDWNNNNIVTRAIARALISSQVNTDQFARFGLPGWSRDTGTNNQISESPCVFNASDPESIDNIHIYSDGLGVQAYWSNLANNCIVPGRGDLDLGTSTDVKNHGGRIMKNPLVVLVFWGPGWLTRTDIPSVVSITAEVKDKLLDNDKVYFSQINQYGGCGVPQFGASVINTSVPFPSNSIATLDHARAVIKSTLQNGSLPTALIDFNDIWFCVIPDYPSDVIGPDGTSIVGWNDVFQPTIILPGEAPEDQGGTPDPTNLEEISGVISFKRDINMQRTNTCQGNEVVQPPSPPPSHDCAAGQHWDEQLQQCVDDIVVDPPPPPGTGGTQIIYKVTSTANQKEISNESSSDNRTRIMQKISGSSCPFKGKIIKQADVILRKESGTNDVTPLIYFKIWNSNNTVKYTSATTFTPDELSTSFRAKTFDLTSNTYVMQVGDKCGIEWTGTDPSEFIWTAYTTSSGTGTNASYSQYKEGSNYDDQTGRNMSMTLWI